MVCSSSSIAISTARLAHSSRCLDCLRKTKDSGNNRIGNFEAREEATTEGVRRFESGPFLALLDGENEPATTVTTIF